MNTQLAYFADPAVQTALHLALSALFARAAWHKLRNRSEFTKTLAAYEILPAPLLAPAGAALATVELSVATALLIPGAGPTPGLAAVTLLLIYTAAMATNWLRGRREIDCGCSRPGRHTPIGPGLMARNVLLAWLALAAALPAGGRALIWLDLVTIAGTGLVAAALYGATEQARFRGARA